MIRVLRYLKQFACWLGATLLFFEIICSIQVADGKMEKKAEVFLQTGHSELLGGLAISPDGQFVSTGSLDNTAKLWELESGKEIRSFIGHKRDVESVAFSPNSRFLLTGSVDGTAKLWDVESGKEIRSFRGDGSGVYHAVFSPDGRSIVGSGNTTTLWDVESGDKIKTFKGSFLALSPDGKYVLTVRDYGTGSEPGDLALWLTGKESGDPTLWEVSSGQKIHALQGHIELVYAAKFSRDGKYILTCSDDHTAKLWDVSTGKEIRTVNKKYSDYCPRPVILPNGRFALMEYLGDEAAIAKIWDIESGSESLVIKGLSGEIGSITFSSDGRFALTSSGGKTAKLWDAKNGKEIREFKGYSKGITSVAFSPDGRLALVGSGEKKAKLWDVIGGRVVREIKGGSRGIASVAFSSDGKLALIGDLDGTAKLWQVSSGRGVHVFKEEDGLRSVAFSPDGRFILTNAGLSAKLWSIENEQPIYTFDAPGHWVIYAAFTPDGRYVLTGSVQQKIKLWEVASGREYHKYALKETGIEIGHGALLMNPPSTKYSVALSPNGRYAMAGDEFNLIKLWEAESGQDIHILRGHENGTAILSVAFSPDGQLALTGGEDQTAKLWAVETGREIREFRGHSGDITALAFSPDGRYVLTGSADSSLKLWEVDSGREICQFFSFEQGEWLALTPEGYFNASPNGAKYLNVRQGKKVYSIDNFFEKFYNPAIVAKVLHGEKIEFEHDIQKGFATPPEIKITHPKPGQSFQNDILQIEVTAQDNGGGIDEIRLYHNGTVVSKTHRAIKRKQPNDTVTKVYQISLVPGENRFRAVGLSKDRTESNPYEVVVQYTAEEKTADLYLTVVGINQYRNPALNLNFAEPDARSLKDFFRRKNKPLFRTVHLNELYNKDAIKSNIINHLKSLSATENDVIVLYLAGHGINIKDEWYFVSYDVIYPERDKDVMAKGLSSSEIAATIREIPALKKLVLIDACKSGAVLTAFANRGLEERRALAQLARATGTHVIAAAGSDQYASEVSQLGHGAFTYSLLQGLGGKAGNQDTKITVREIMAYIEDELPKVSEKYSQQPQFPVIDSRGQDFPLVVTDEASDPQFLTSALHVEALPIPTSKTGTLIVHSDAPDTKIRIMNIKPQFYQGIKLSPGRYKLEASSPGCNTETIWINLSRGEKKEYVFLLDWGQKGYFDGGEEYAGNQYSLFLDRVNRDISAIKTPGGKTIRDFDVSDKLLANKKELVALIVESASMDELKEVEKDEYGGNKRQYWFDLLPLMNSKQIKKLFEILKNEKKELSSLDFKNEKESEKTQAPGKYRLQYLTKALGLFPNSADTYYRRGNTWASLGDPGKALSDYDRSLEIDPYNAWVYNAKAWLLSTNQDGQIRNGDAAIRIAEYALKLNSHADIWDTLAAAYAEGRQFEKALTTQKKVIMLLTSKDNKVNLDEYKNRLLNYQARKPWRN